ncbi:glycosyltransferase [Mangrovitalea sediminis]|uniref:glycosyltransferase n=1 Tax=Mangrovitalea sediminis TaxID=1982043 RepID=UPI000BE54B1D|nr:glycosyltransferase [Mangrovitalea sediminis]
MSRKSLAFHKDVIEGKRKAYAWGLGGAMQYLLLQAPYRFDGIIDGLAKDDSKGTVSGIPLYSPDVLSQLDPLETTIVVFADPIRFFRQIKRQVRRYGEFPVVMPFVEFRDYPLLSGDKQVRSEARVYWRSRLRHALHDMRGAESIKPVKNRVALWNYALAKGGAERQLVLLALGLRKLGWEVDFITIGKDQPKTDSWANEMRLAGVNRFILPTQRDYLSIVEEDSRERAIASYLGPYFVLPALHEMVATATILWDRKPELLISYLDYSNIVAAIAAVASGVPKILMSGRNVAPSQFPGLRGFPIKKHELKGVYRSLLELPGVYLCNNSQSGAESYRRWLGLASDSGKISVVPNAVSTPVSSVHSDVRKSFNLGATSPLIVGVMRFSEEKCPQGFVDVFERVLSRHPDAHAILVGDGALKSQIQKVVAERGLTRQLHFAGMQDLSYPFLRAADLLLLTSRMEGMPNVILEAQSVGCPVVATRVGGVMEAMAPVLHSNVFEFQDWESMAARCSELLTDPDRRKWEGSQARKYLLENRDSVTLAKQTLAACERVEAEDIGCHSRRAFDVNACSSPIA